MSNSNVFGRSCTWTAVLFLFLSTSSVDCAASQHTPTASETLLHPQQSSRNTNYWINESNMVYRQSFRSDNGLRGGAAGTTKGSSVKLQTKPRSTASSKPVPTSRPSSRVDSDRKTTTKPRTSSRGQTQRSTRSLKSSEINNYGVQFNKVASTLGKSANDIKRWSRLMLNETQVMWNETETNILKPAIANADEMAGTVMSSIGLQLRRLSQEIKTTMHALTTFDVEDDASDASSSRSPRFNPSQSIDGSLGISRNNSVSTIPMVFLPMRIVKLSLAAWVISEVLEYCGLIDTENTLLSTSSESITWKTSRLRQHLTSIWHHAQPQVTKLNERINNWWHRYGTIFRKATWSSRHQLQVELSYWKPKYVFGVGAGLGLVVAPLAYSLCQALFPPLALAYGLAELNHYSKSKYDISLSSLVLLSRNRGTSRSLQEESRQSSWIFRRNRPGRGGGGSSDKPDGKSSPLPRSLDSSLEQYRSWVKNQLKVLNEIYSLNRKGVDNDFGKQAKTLDDHAMNATVEKYLDKLFKRSTTSRSLKDICRETHDALDSVPQTQLKFTGMTNQEYLRFRRVSELLTRGLTMGAFLGILSKT